MHEILVLIAYATNTAANELVCLCGLTRAFTACTQSRDAEALWPPGV